MSPYFVTEGVRPDTDLPVFVADVLEEMLPKGDLTRGSMCSADSYYGSFGRESEMFADRNEYLLCDFIQEFGDCLSLDQDTFTLYALSKILRKKFYVASVGIVTEDAFGKFETGPAEMAKTVENEIFSCVAALKTVALFEPN